VPETKRTSHVGKRLNHSKNPMMDAPRNNGQDMSSSEVIVFGLIDSILGILKQSGATLEQSMAAVQSVQAMLPVVGLQSRKEITFRCR
jgi:hypothetical protein